MKRMLRAFLVLTFITSLLAGCGSSNSASEKTNSTSTQSTTQESTSTQPTTKDSTPATVDKTSFKGKIEITLPAGDYVDYVKKNIAPYFEQEYPNVKVTVSPEGGTDKLMARVAAGDVPDIYAGVFGYQPAQLAKLGKIVPLESMPGATELNARIDPKYIHKDFGHQYYIPWNVTTQMMIYNKDLFKEADLDPNSPPKTYEEFLQDAKKINALPKRKDGENVYGTIFWNDALNWGGWYWTMLAQMYYNFNDGKYQLFNKLGSDVVFDNPDAKMADFFSFLQKAQAYAPKTMEKNFFNRNVGMWLQYGYGWKTNLKTAKDTPMEIGKDVGIAPIPVVNAGQTSWTTLDGRSLMIFKKNPAQEKLAFEFVKFMMEDKYNLEADKSLGQLPTLKSLETDPFFQLPENKPFLDQLQHALPNESIATLDDVSNTLEKVIIKVQLEKSLTPEQGVKQAAAEARKILQGKK